MTDNAIVADVLERAADLYEAEQIEWCTFRWIQKDSAPLPGTDKQVWAYTGKMSMCAEGALLKAVGFTDEWIGNFGDHGVLTAEDDASSAYHTFLEALHAVEERLPAIDPDSPRIPEELLFPNFSTLGDAWSLAGWNDQVATKAQVIEVFKATAKDLRNEG